MESKERQSTWTKFPLGLLGMAVLVMAVESTVRFRLDQISDWMSFTWRYASRRVDDMASRSEVIVLGDSLVKEGVLPPLIEGRVGASVYNLSVHGGTAPSSYCLLKRLVEKGERPRVLVVDFHPNLLAIAPRSNDYWAELLTPLELADLCWRTSDPLLFGKTCVEKAIPSYRHRVQVRAAVLAALRGEPLFATRFNDLLRLNYERNRGAQLLPIQDQSVTFDASSRVETKHLVWKAHRVNATYVRGLLELPEANDISVVWLLPPMSPNWVERRRAMNADAPHEAFVRAMNHEFPKMIVVDGRESGYPNSAFKDMTHLHVGGASELSKGLATVLLPLLRSPRTEIAGELRWLRLPPYQGEPVDPCLEVFDETSLALRPARETLTR